MRDDYAERLRSFELLGLSKERVLDSITRVLAGDLAQRALEGVQRLLDRAVAEAVDRDLQPV